VAASSRDFLQTFLRMLTFKRSLENKHLEYIQLLNRHQYQKINKNKSVDARKVCQQNLVLVFSVNDRNNGIKSPNQNSLH